MAKIVNGLCDNLLTSVVRAWDTTGAVDGAKKKILVAPAMNTCMWNHPVTGSQLRVLDKEWGGENGWFEVLRPISKGLACGDVGDGAMVTWQRIVQEIEEKIKANKSKHLIDAQMRGLCQGPGDLIRVMRVGCLADVGSVGQRAFPRRHIGACLKFDTRTHILLIVRENILLPILTFSHLRHPGHCRLLPSLRSSLFTPGLSLSTMDSASRHLLNSTSSLWTEDVTCPSTLRARLRDHDTPATSSSTKLAPYQDVYQQVQACLGSHLLDPKQDKKVLQLPAPEAHDPAAELREAYARNGMALHAAAVEKLINAHSEVQSRITRFSNDSAATLSQCNALYSNIAYPLSATLCHDNTHPRATIATHLSDLKKEIARAKEEIVQLSHEWDACCRSEAEAWKDLNRDLDNQGQAAAEPENEATKIANAFKTEAEDIVKAKCRELGDIEKEFKADIQAETLKMMQNFCVDE
ncbi:hypothetical protein NM208_g16297 [Fusarium decemcellulare]|uniref:Uncharacterized protein n=1 Tax=Fusarium decemcellulare TaxID=57161 RepID=A0ACC1RD96_9HYPO|nr:hypothetical protein NM208_g16297 [Fusarium decemcellulare]